MGRYVNLDPTIKQTWTKVTIIINGNHDDFSNKEELIKDWCLSMIAGRWGHTYFRGHGYYPYRSYISDFYFKNPKDAVYFRMCW